MVKYRSHLLLSIFIVLSLGTLNSCKDNKKFDRIKWSESVDPAFPPPEREKMLLDLTTNHKLVGLKYFQLIDTLGEPDFEDSVSLAYKIEEDYGRDIDPIYAKDLVFYFSKNDSIITSFKIREWKK